MTGWIEAGEIVEEETGEVYIFPFAVETHFTDVAGFCLSEKLREVGGVIGAAKHDFIVSKLGWGFSL